jgi:Rrf2 family protein
MKLSNTSEYALRILSFMAKEPEQLYTAKQLVDKLIISDKYLRRLMTTLTKVGFIRSTQGRDGGYSFARSIHQIYLFDIIDAVEGMDKYMGCIMGFEQCSDENPCVMHNFWVKIRTEFQQSFHQTSLADFNFDATFKY